MTILAGDVGGTKTNLALFESADQNPGRILSQRSLESSGFSSIESLIAEFLRDSTAIPTSLCLGVAGPVVDQEVRAANLAWVVSVASLSREFGFPSIKLINDLEATAYGIDTLSPDKFCMLNEGVQRPTGNRALIAAGTGLGMGMMIWNDGDFRTVPSEGGHGDLPVSSDMELEFFRYLKKKFDDHVSCERALSGPGLLNIYSFLKEGGFAVEPEWLATEISQGNAGAAISAAALSERSELASMALDIFVGLYGTIAGNLALMTVSTGGLYVGGGIAPKIVDRLKSGLFMERFAKKGRMSKLVSQIPVRVIMDPMTAVYGAARYAVGHSE